MQEEEPKGSDGFSRSAPFLVRALWIDKARRRCQPSLKAAYKPAHSFLGGDGLVAEV
jgi:hypothetical protein